MEAYSVETTVQPDGSVRIESLPFHAGERVQVIVVATSPAEVSDDPASLRGSVMFYDRPFDPAVPEDDWEVNR